MYRYNQLKIMILLLGVFSFFQSCKPKIEEAAAYNDIPDIPKQENPVSVEALAYKPFVDELIANGKLIANKKNDLKFEASGILERVYVKNGQKVSKGQVLAKTDDKALLKEKRKAIIAEKKALLEIKDMLVGRGYDFDDRKNIPEQVYEMTAIRSGYADAKNALQDIENELKKTKVKAPFSGTVGALQVKEFQQISTGEDFLTLIDDHYFDVSFYLIETDIHKVVKGDIVDISAFGDLEVSKGKIKSINPIVEENGTVLVKARVKNPDKFIEGMNVKVSIRKERKEDFIVAKSAIVRRNNKEIVFKYKKGKAYWTYVKTLYENSSSVAIVADPEKRSSKLEIGDTIITSGNLHLAHNVDVIVK